MLRSVGNFYTPLRGLLENAVNAGFVAPQNLSLCHIIDLPGGSAANIDESRAGEWGEVTMKALREWSIDVSHPGSLPDHDRADCRPTSDTASIRGKRIRKQRQPYELDSYPISLYHHLVYWNSVTLVRLDHI